MRWRGDGGEMDGGEERLDVEQLLVLGLLLLGLVRREVAAHLTLHRLERLARGRGLHRGEG